MRYVKKMLAGMLLVGMMVTANGVEVYAASHIPGCSSQGTNVVCTGPMKDVSMTTPHLLYQSVNGPVYCGVVAISGNHSIYCSNTKDCGVFLYTSYRTHLIDHDICPDETGVCQY